MVDKLILLCGVHSPIHTQRFFLDRKLRKELWEKKGIKSWRIHQRPGQVVFIPAG